MNTNVTALHRRSVAAVVAGAAALLVGLGAHTCSASTTSEPRPALADSISNGAMHGDDPNFGGNGHPGAVANPYQRGCSAATRCRS
jgi:hypothetical protein